MKSESSMTPTKRVTAASFTIPTSTSTPRLSIPLDKTNVVSRPSSESSFKPRKSELKPESSLHPSTLSEKLKRVSAHHDTPASRPNLSSGSGWSLGLFRKLLWRVRRYTMWDSLVFCSFAVAAIVFFSALFGVGYTSEEPVPARFASWRASGLGVVAQKRARGTSASDLIEDYLKFSGFGPREAVKVAEEVYFEESEKGDATLEPMSPSAGRRGHGPPPSGAWHQPRRRMITKYEPSIYPPHEYQDGRRRSRRLPWVEPPPPSPFHGPYHKRLSELSTPSGATDHDSGADDDRGEPLWGLDEDDNMEDPSSEEDVGDQEA